jgi:alpha-beta hydrolase superfamily lysophospholipase
MRRALALVLVLVGLAVPAPASAAPEPIDEIDVSFTVRNTNRSSVPCPSDGRTYTVKGTLVGPAGSLAAPTSPRINVLVHDITTGGWFWRMPGHPDVDYAARLADGGEISLVIDRLGYDASPVRSGTSTCLGSQADVLHQIIEQVRAGSASVPAPEEVVVHAHSVGAAIAQAEASRWKDVDGLVLMSWSDAGVAPRAVRESAVQHAACLLGGGRDGAPRGYAWYGRTEADFRSIHFATAADGVQRDAAGLRNPDPCGDAISLAQLVVLGNLLTRTIDVPVLLLFGGEDVLNRPGAAHLQRNAYSPGAEVTVHEDPAAGGALPLEAGAADLRSRILDWLSAG